MYYRRFKRDILDFALATERITTDEYCQIIQFHSQERLTIPENDLERLESILDLEKVGESNEQGFVMVRVRKWPFNKNMCLKFQQSAPTEWRYENEEEKVLFYYSVAEKRLEFPDDDI